MALSIAIDKQVTRTVDFVPTQLLWDLRKELGLDTNVRFVYEGDIIQTDEEEQEVTLQDIVPEGTTMLQMRHVPRVKNPHPKSVFLHQQNGLNLYRFPQYTPQKVAKSRFRETIPSEILREAKFVLLLGESGGGKSTLINAIANFWLGVEFQDPFRYVLVDESAAQTPGASVTSEVNMYVLEGSEAKPTLVLIDTPGYGDTAGIGRDQTTDKLLEQMFGRDLDTLHMICLVAKASTVRFTETQTYIYRKTLSWFDDEFLSSFMCLFTFSDQGTPQVIKELQSSNSILAPMIQQNRGKSWFLKVNNSSLYESPSDDTFVKLWWDFTANSISLLASRLSSCDGISLSQMKSRILKKTEIEKQIQITSSHLEKLCKSYSINKKIAQQLKYCGKDTLRETNFKLAIEEGLFERQFCPKLGLNHLANKSSNFQSSFSKRVHQLGYNDLLQKFESVKYVSCRHRNIDLGLVEEAKEMCDQILMAIKKLVELEQETASLKRPSQISVVVTELEVQAKLEQLLTAFKRDPSEGSDAMVETLQEVSEDHRQSLQGTHPKLLLLQELKQQFAAAEHAIPQQAEKARSLRCASEPADVYRTPRPAANPSWFTRYVLNHKAKWLVGLGIVVAIGFGCYLLPI